MSSGLIEYVISILKKNSLYMRMSDRKPTMSQKI